MNELLTAPAERGGPLDPNPRYTFCDLQRISKESRSRPCCLDSISCVGWIAPGRAEIALFDTTVPQLFPKCGFLRDPALASLLELWLAVAVLYFAAGVQLPLWPEMILKVKNLLRMRRPAWIDLENPHEYYLS
jgi:hypothetical protein